MAGYHSRANSLFCRSCAPHATGQLTAVDDTAWNAQCPAQVPARAAAGAALVSIREETGALSKSLRCAEINPIYSSAIEGAICERGTSDMALALSGFLLVAVLLTVTAVLSIMLLRRKGHAAANIMAESSKDVTILEEVSNLSAAPMYGGWDLQGSDRQMERPH